MPTVTVAGAHGQTVSLNFDTAANAALAQQLAAAITAGVHDGSILPAVDTDGLPPPLPPGATGLFVQDPSGLTILPPGYKAYVDTAPQAVVFGSGDGDELLVLSSAGSSLSFFATGGSGTVVAGGGNNNIVIPSTDAGNWSINTGNGDDTVLAQGPGNDTINPGGGNNNILLGSGNTVMQSTGDDTVSASGGQATIAAIGQTSDLIYGGNQLFYVGTQGGSATVFGGTGSDTFFGGKGPDLVQGEPVATTSCSRARAARRCSAVVTAISCSRPAARPRHCTRARATRRSTACSAWALIRSMAAPARRRSTAGRAMIHSSPAADHPR